MNLQKSHWQAQGDKVSLQMPISKIDEEKRLVSGFATLDNVDRQDDVVLTSASVAAFKRFQGNIREMHEPIAAGRLVDFKEDSFYDTDTKKFYRGVYVTVYVSKGAESTWQKVLDGTLSGFSIGGNINDSEMEFSKDNGKPVRFIKDYDLSELSLVDVPCNQFALVASVQKSDAGTFMKGMVTETHLVNVFWCPTDEIAKTSTEEAQSCNHCGGNMQSIGWFEKGDDDFEKTTGIVNDFLRQKEDAVTKQQENTGEGGVEMADEEKNEVAEDVVTSDDVTDESKEAGALDAGSEHTKTSDQVVDEEEETGVVEAETEPDLEKMFDDLKGSVRDSIEKTVTAVEAKVAEATKAFDEKASEFEKSLGELRESLDSIRSEREDVAKRLDVLEKATAIKKSGTVEAEPVEKVQKSQKGLWAGAFFDAE